MQSIETYGTFEQAIAKADPEAQELARQARKMIIAVMPEVVEVPWPRLRIASYGVGPKKNEIEPKAHVCCVGANSGSSSVAQNCEEDWAALTVTTTALEVEPEKLPPPL